MKFFRKYFFYGPEVRLSIEHLLCHSLVRSAILFIRREPRRHGEYRNSLRFLPVFLCVFVSLWSNTISAQRTEISLNKNWYTRATDTLQKGYDAFEMTAFDSKDKWKQIDVPHNWDEYDGYRRLRHGNRHGYAYYVKYFRLPSQPKNN